MADGRKFHFWRRWISGGLPLELFCKAVKQNLNIHVFVGPVAERGDDTDGDFADCLAVAVAS